MTDSHSIQVQPERNGYGITWYRAVCTCGYRSPRRQSPGGTALAARAHLKAKSGVAR